MNPITPALYIILSIATTTPNWPRWPYPRQENMLLLHPRQHTPSTCLHIFSQGWDSGMNAYSQTLFPLLQQDVMRKLPALKVIGTKNCMDWIISFMLTCKKEKMIRQNNR